MQKRKNRWYIAVAAVVILAVVLVVAVVLGKKGKNKKDPKMIEPTQQEQASEIPTETEEVFDYSATETAETKSLPKSVVSKQGILIDVDAGTILAGKDALKRMVPASMTKIFTVLVAAENIKPEQLDELEDSQAFENIRHMPARVKCAVLGWHTLDEALKEKEEEKKN